MKLLPSLVMKICSLLLKRVRRGKSEGKGEQSCRGREGLNAQEDQKAGGRKREGWREKIWSSS